MTGTLMSSLVQEQRPESLHPHKGIKSSHILDTLSHNHTSKHGTQANEAMGKQQRIKQL